MLTDKTAQTVACMLLLMLLHGLCCGEDSRSRKYDIVVMRQHLLKCGRMTAFPSSYRENGPIVATTMIKVHEVLLPIIRFWSNDPNDAVLAKNGSTRNVTPLFPKRPGGLKIKSFPRKGT